MRQAAIAALLAGLAACGGPAQDKAPPANPPAAPPAVGFRAAGTEPFWALEIEPNRLVFRTPEDTAGFRFPHPASTMRGDTTRWTDVVGARSIEARLWPAQCSDGMSDRAWTHRAVVRVDTVTYRGCADQT